MCKACDAREMQMDGELQVEALIGELNMIAGSRQSDLNDDGHIIALGVKQLERFVAAARLIDEFAWASLKPDCMASGDEANRRISCVRAALRGQDFINT